MLLYRIDGTWVESLFHYIVDVGVAYSSKNPFFRKLHGQFPNRFGNDVPLRLLTTSVYEMTLTKTTFEKSTEKKLIRPISNVVSERNREVVNVRTSPDEVHPSQFSHPKFNNTHTSDAISLSLTTVTYEYKRIWNGVQVAIDFTLEKSRQMLYIRSIRIFVLLWQLQTFESIFVSALSSSNPASDLHLKFNKLHAALASPSGKLTYSPEILIPEPRDATSILLLTNSVQTLSERIRSGKANVAFLRGSITALQTFTNEQASALGNFPGPVPAVYCYNGNTPDVSFVDIASSGADGVLMNLCANMDEVQSINDIVDTADEWVDSWKAAVSAGLQPIPELQIGESFAQTFSEENLNHLITMFTERVGIEPAALVFTANQNIDDDETHQPIPIPNISKSLSKRIPIIGSIRANSDGENRLLYEETIRYKDAGYTGTFLRWDCIPGYQLQPNLELVGKFWFACISDLKSTRSKSFSFRAKNQMDVSAATKWGNYQRDVIESGALGDPGETASLNEADGDYQGFG